MLKAELRKTWSRPLIAIAFVIVCLIQVVYAFNNYNEDIRTLSDAYNVFGGYMNDSWREDIHKNYIKLWKTQPESEGELWMATWEQKAIRTAYDYSFFTEMLDHYVETLSSTYGETAVVAYANLRTASENGELIFGASPAGESMTNQYMVTWGFLIFMILLCVDQFSGEKELEMIPMQCVSKYGRRKLLHTKILVCQFSAFFVWVVLNTIYAFTLVLCYGSGNLRSVIQDFSFNACPYNWNMGQYLIVILATGFITSQLTALMTFLLAKIGRTTQRSFVLMVGILVLPYLLAFFLNSTWLAMWLPCLIHNQWLWNGLRLLQVGKRYISFWCVAKAEIILIVVTIIFLLHRLLNKAETDIEM